RKSARRDAGDKEKSKSRDHDGLRGSGTRVRTNAKYLALALPTSTFLGPDAVTYPTQSPGRGFHQSHVSPHLCPCRRRWILLPGEAFAGSDLRDAVLWGCCLP